MPKGHALELLVPAYLAVVWGLTLSAIACGTHLSTLDAQRLDTSAQLAASIVRELPDSGTVRVKGNAMICDLRAVENSAGIHLVDGGTRCPTQH